MKLLLARHGNTFAPEVVPVFVGSKDDMPLVEEGLLQAERFATVLKERGTKIAGVYCGPLQRTLKFAELVMASLKLDLKSQVDERLNELDYGGWNGKTNDEIISEFGKDAFDGWNDRSTWPAGSGWPSSPEELSAEVKSFVDDLKSKYGEHETVLVVTSNGRMRYFLKQVPGAFELKQSEHKLKVAPGNFCEITFAQHAGIATVESWNCSPKQLLSTR